MYIRASFVYIESVQDKKYLCQRSVWEKNKRCGWWRKAWCAIVMCCSCGHFLKKGGRTRGCISHLSNQKSITMFYLFLVLLTNFWKLHCLWEGPWHNFLFCSCECLSVSLWWMFLALLHWVPCSAPPRATRVSGSHVFSLGCQHHLHWLIHQGTEKGLLFNSCLSHAVLLLGMWMHVFLFFFF